MEPNVGATDRSLRLMAGGVLILIGAFTSKILWIFGLVAILTAVFRFCPLYKALGKSTCPPAKG